MNKTETAVCHTYRPYNNYPFNNDPLPEHFSLEMVEQYSSLGHGYRGVVELTDDGVVALQKDAISLYTDFTRVFLVANGFGRTALIELSEESMCLEAAAEYLDLHGDHVQGVHVREYGRLGAAIINACCSFQSQIDLNGHEDNVIVTGRSLNRCTFERGVRRIQVESIKFDASSMIKNVPGWTLWQRVKSSAATMVNQGSIPAGVSLHGLQATDEGQKVDRLVPVVGRPFYSSRSQVVCVTAPNGTVCLMCLDMLGAMRASIDMNDSLIMEWLRERVPEEVLCQHDLQSVLYSEIAERVVAHHRHCETLSLPLIDSGYGGKHPMLLDYVVVEPMFMAHHVYSSLLKPR